MTERYTIRTNDNIIAPKLCNLHDVEKVLMLLCWLADTEDELQKYRQAEAEGRLVVLPCKPNGAYWHRNYDTGQLELNFEMHSLREHDDTYPEYDKCAYWE